MSKMYWEPKQISVIDLPEGEHLIDSFVGNSSGPTLIVIGSLHGNEISGVAALTDLRNKISELRNKLKGRVYFIAGNTRAIREQKRFIDSDLNRFWTAGNISKVGSEDLLEVSEGRELTELDQLLDSILITAMDEVYVLDLHSTSADGSPFATVGDTLRNRKFARKFPITILLGIEEQLEGTMLEYLNNAGAVTLGFEGGQHVSEKTVENHRSLVRHALVAAGILDAGLIDTSTAIGTGAERTRFFEVRFRHAITQADEFRMVTGFNNFDHVRKGQVLGHDKNGAVTARESGVLLMPLYQKLGDDGFFLGREIAPFWLYVSGFLRRLGIQNLIHILPGVKRDPSDPASLIVDTRIARLLPLQIFHLLGFRRRRWAGHKLVVSRRKHDTSGPFQWRGDLISAKNP